MGDYCVVAHPASSASDVLAETLETSIAEPLPITIYRLNCLTPFSSLSPIRLGTVQKPTPYSNALAPFFPRVPASRHIIHDRDAHGLRLDRSDDSELITMGDAAHVQRRQIWARPTTTTSTSMQPSCTPVLLPSNGVIHLNRTYQVTLSDNVVFQPACTGDSSANELGNPTAVIDLRDPFYASTSPQLYAIGCATVVSYLLVIILFITPRTFFIGGPGGGANFLGRHGMTYGSGSSVIGIGGRPWLQKVAALTVAISLTIATVDSFKVAERQYDSGYMDADSLTDEVIDGLEIRIVRVISSTFLWLAQVQTLIRLFPRHKEKVIIKWAGFALIVLDTLFSILNNFVDKGISTRPRLFDDAIPALSYLFELALNLLYAAWVIFYSVTKHRFAFFHPKMRNICLVALLSLCAVFIPVVFFVLDISQPNVAGWGEYIRWVGAAAASVVVWEWVERIEALERDERKDGILGREIFDGDEMLEVTPSEEVDWPRKSDPGPYDGRATGASSGWGGVRGPRHRPLRSRVGFQRSHRGQSDNRNQHIAAATEARRDGGNHPSPPPAVLTPVSRADTTSAASTVYYVRYHPVSSPSPVAVNPAATSEEEDGPKMETIVEAQQQHLGTNQPARNSSHTRPATTLPPSDPRWYSLFNSFKRRRASPPTEVVTAQAEEQGATDDNGVERSGPPGESHGRRVLIPRVDNLLNRRRDRAGQDGPEPGPPLPITVIPARDRGQQTWSPKGFDDSNVQDESDGSDNDRTPGRRNLPVMVIPSRTRSAAPWPQAAAGATGHGNNELRYDPETAALVGLDPGPVRHAPDSQEHAISRTTSEHDTTFGSDERTVVAGTGSRGSDSRDSMSTTSSDTSYFVQGPIEHAVHHAAGAPGENGSMAISTQAPQPHHHPAREHGNTDLEAGLGPGTGRQA
ncbi:pH-response regulator protein palH/RIM21 [Paecilomyces variotii No. 5]|uniref:pH-response regulator protein palH/RIM21 n=1 Tax=Byssochlamys spectabilis (strain No. 5 / NBRC 109023) TaxID=1356009 RepID=V5FU07_BYSSN|nr:pH-response regulator protein palH/RIM21 [Paecilomyces variotii No. 5]